MDHRPRFAEVLRQARRLVHYLGLEIPDSDKQIRPEFGGCFALCLVRGGLGVTCFHYIAGVGGWWGLSDGGVVPGAGVCSDGGEGPVL